MADEIFFGPSIAIVGTIVALNSIYCCLGVRRIRRIEQRIHSLEERQPSIPTAAAATATATAIDIQPQQMMYPPTTYAAPNPSYTYYQQQQQPTAPRYYSQDPQTLYR